MLRVRCAACKIEVHTEGALRAHWMSEDHMKNLIPWRKKEAERDAKKKAPRKKKNEY